jgi:hypothetical protein
MLQYVHGFCASESYGFALGSAQAQFPEEGGERMSEVLILARGLLTSVLKDAAHSLAKQILLHVKKRTAPTGSSDGSDNASNV